MSARYRFYFCQFPLSFTSLYYHITLSISSPQDDPGCPLDAALVVGASVARLSARACSPNGDCEEVRTCYRRLLRCRPAGSAQAVCLAEGVLNACCGGGETTVVDQGRIFFSRKSALGYFFTNYLVAPYSLLNTEYV